MYGTVANIKAKKGQEQALISMLEDWDRNRRPVVKGAVASYLYKLDERASEFIMVAVFQDKKTYVANAEDPAQDKWYRKLRDLLDADPVWHDGEVVGHYTYDQQKAA